VWQHTAFGGDLLPLPGLKSAVVGRVRGMRQGRINFPVGPDPEKDEAHSKCMLAFNICQRLRHWAHLMNPWFGCFCGFCLSCNSQPCRLCRTGQDWVSRKS
jgi:hypothetical protein